MFPPGRHTRFPETYFLGKFSLETEGFAASQVQLPQGKVV